MSPAPACLSRPLSRWSAVLAIAFSCGNSSQASEGAPVYSLSPRVLDAGGRRVSSSSYTVDASLGGILGVSTAPAPAATARQGYIAQLFEPVALQITTPQIILPYTVGEDATIVLTAVATLDDGTTARVQQVLWNFTGAGATISSTGEFYPAAVYRNSSARITGTWQGLTASTNLTVLDTLKDNFGSYAADGLRDAWQVQNFGLDHPQAGPNAAPSGDGIVNLLKHAWNLPPSDRQNGPAYTTAQGNLSITFRRLKPGVPLRPTYRVQVSGDLITWQDHLSPGAPFTTETAVVSIDAETELVTVRDNIAASTASRRFIRLLVTYP